MEPSSHAVKINSTTGSSSYAFDTSTNTSPYFKEESAVEQEVNESASMDVYSDQEEENLDRNLAEVFIAKDSDGFVRNLSKSSYQAWAVPNILLVQSSPVAKVKSMICQIDDMISNRINVASFGWLPTR